jgi:hypothetical protein
MATDASRDSAVTKKKVCSACAHVHVLQMHA